MNEFSSFIKECVDTPAYVFSEDIIRDNCSNAKSIIRTADTYFLYSIKSLELAPVLRIIKGYVDGFAVSSLFEAQLARDILGNDGAVHLTTPGIRPNEIAALSNCCDSITLNSLRQFNNLHKLFPNNQELSLRINPEHRMVKEKEYDPCCDNSKLGIPLSEMVWQLEKNPNLLAPFSGIHFHNNCEGRDFKDLEDTVDVIINSMGKYLNQIKWINMGGGYYFDNPKNPESFKHATHKLQQEYGLQTYFEPGAGIVNSAGYLICTVIDIVGPREAQVAILDTSINHLPEVFEYKYSPKIIEASTGNTNFSYTLAGSSCLAGDQFGHYSFNEPLKIGQRLVIKNIGAYSYVKSHFFNGINLPTSYLLDASGQAKKIMSFNYSDFAKKNALEEICQ